MKKWLLALGITALLLMPLAAQKTEIPGLYHYVLDNGLELFVLENHSTPLVYVEIAIRGGGITQTKDTAGLFHLYEHMMFKGNSKYKTAAEIQTAIADLGVASWNGSTGAEYVNYYFTIPSVNLKAGLEFWSYAVREPLITEKELETEKGVVVSELTGDIPDPGHIRYAGLNRYLFPKFPWRRDPGGSVDVVKNCTVKMLKDMQATYYVPNNAALFVGGDVNPEEVLALVKQTYGGWAKAADPWATPLEPQAFPASDKPVYLVFPDKNFNKNYAVMQVYYRGPDVQRQPEPTYAADVWGFLIDNPSGSFKKAIVNNSDLGVRSPYWIYGYYWTQRDGGQIVFSAYSWTSDKTWARKAIMFEETIRKSEAVKMSMDPGYFSVKDYEITKQILEDNQIIELETVNGFLGTLRFWWASASTDYYFGYVKNMKKVGFDQIRDYVKTFIVDNQPVVTVRMNAGVYASQKKLFDEAGFIAITEENAYWWKK